MDNSFDRLINRVLDGRYRIENVLGIGGMAYVLKATDLQTNRIVAIKILNDEFNSDERAVKRFVNESEAVSMLNAPNIVKIYDVAISETLKYIVMEFIDGITLKDYMDKIGAIGWKEAVHYVRQILSGLSHAHEKGIIHRDVKPQNVMLLKDGHVKVTDFGIAKLPKAEPITMTDKAIGTVNYISPEQASGGHVDFKSDLYSVGVMLYEMVTGKLPFVADSPVAVAMMQVSNEPVPPREINPQIPVGLEQIILKAMSKEPDARFSSANSMIKALDYFAKNPTIVFAQADTTSSGNAKIRPIDTISDTSEKKNDKKSEKKGRSMLPIILGITLAFFVVAIGTVIFLLSSRNVGTGDGMSAFDKLLGVDSSKDDERKFVVDDFTDKIYSEAFIDELDKKGYKVKKVIYVGNESKAESAIVNQDPEPGATKMKPENNGKIEITLYVNKGAVETQMPDCTGKTESSAINELVKEFNSMLFDSYNRNNITIVEKNDAEVTKGFVISSEPSFGERITVTKDLKVTLYVSTGPESKLVLMPSVVGKTSEDAKRLIEETGLSMGTVIVEENAEYPSGTVIRASVDEGIEVDTKDTVVDIWVSREKKQTSQSTEKPDTAQNGSHTTTQTPSTNTNNSQNQSSGNNTSSQTTPSTQTPSNGENTQTPSENQSGQGDSAQNQESGDAGLDSLLEMRENGN